MAASPIISAGSTAKPLQGASARLSVDRQVAEFSGIFREHELTRKDLRLSSGIAALDAALNGGIVRGRVSEIVGRPGFGRTSLAISFAAVATRRGEVAAWIDSSGAFDPASVKAAGADLSRILWVGADAASRACDPAGLSAAEFTRSRPNVSTRAGIKPALMAAEAVLGAGGFGLVVIDFGAGARMLGLSTALRLARAAERGGAAVVVMAERRMCGTFAALSLVLGRSRPSFSRTAPGAPALFDGICYEACVVRNKLGGSGQAAAWRALVDPNSPLLPSPPPALYRAAPSRALSAAAMATHIAASQPAAVADRARAGAHLMRRPRHGAASLYAR